MDWIGVASKTVCYDLHGVVVRTPSLTVRGAFYDRYRRDPVVGRGLLLMSEMKCIAQVVVGVRGA